MTAQQLRNSILQQAIQGRLVPQDPNDEPICLSKVTPINDEDKEFSTPSNWVWCQLGDVIKISSGDGLTSKQMHGGTIPVYGGNGITGYHDEFNVSVPTVVIGRVGFYCGSVHLTEKYAWITDNAFKTYFSDSVFDTNYLVHFLRYLNLGRHHNATAQPVVSGKKIYPIVISLPPLAEQRRIVAKIEELMPLVEKYGKAQSELDNLNASLPSRLRQSILQEAFMGKLLPQCNEQIELGKLDRDIKVSLDECPYQLPDNWIWVLHNTIIDISGGSQPPKNMFESKPKEGYVRLYQIRDYGQSPVPVFISEEQATKRTKKGDILLARYGGSLGKVFWAEEGAYNVAMVKVIPLVNDTILDSHYLYYFYHSSLYREAIFSNSRSAQAGFNKDNLEGLYFPLPPLAEQRRIVAKIEELFAEIDKLK